MKKPRSPNADPNLGREREDRLPQDAAFFETLLLEDELVDDYVSGKLTRRERECFEKYFLTTPDRSAKLRFARALNEYITSVALREALKGIWERSLRRNWHCIGLLLSSGVVALVLL